MVLLLWKLFGSSRFFYFYECILMSFQEELSLISPDPKNSKASVVSVLTREPCSSDDNSSSSSSRAHVGSPGSTGIFDPLCSSFLWKILHCTRFDRWGQAHGDHILNHLVSEQKVLQRWEHTEFAGAKFIHAKLQLFLQGADFIANIKQQLNRATEVPNSAKTIRKHPKKYK